MCKLYPSFWYCSSQNISWKDSDQLFYLLVVCLHPDVDTWMLVYLSTQHQCIANMPNRCIPEDFHNGSPSDVETQHLQTYIIASYIAFAKWDRFREKGSNTYTVHYKISSTPNTNEMPALRCMAYYKFRALQLHDRYSVRKKQCVQDISDF